VQLFRPTKLSGDLPSRFTPGCADRHSLLRQTRSISAGNACYFFALLKYQLKQQFLVRRAAGVAKPFDVPRPDAYRVAALNR
jgi:hypothetical protein